MRREAYFQFTHEIWGIAHLKMDKTVPSLVAGAKLSMPAGGMHRSLSRGKRSQSNIFGQGKPNADITGAQPFLTLSHRDLHGCMGSSRSSRHTGAKREQRNFLVSGWHCFCTSGIQDEACCRTSFMVSCPSRFGRRISVYSMSWHRRRFGGIGLQLFFLKNNSCWPKLYNPWIASVQGNVISHSTVTVGIKALILRARVKAANSKRVGKKKTKKQTSVRGWWASVSVDGSSSSGRIPPHRRFSSRHAWEESVRKERVSTQRSSYQVNPNLTPHLLLLWARQAFFWFPIIAHSILSPVVFRTAPLSISSSFPPSWK